MANSKKKCRACKEYAPVESGIKVPLGFFCSMSCVVEHGKKGATAVSEKRKREANAKLKESLKTASQYRAEAQKAFNAYIRWRDRDLPCISCDAAGLHEGHGGYWDAGHFISRSVKGLAFNTHNVHKQCHKCNRFLGSNAAFYREGLIEKIGIDKVEALEDRKHDIVRQDIAFLKRIKSVFTRKLRLKKRLNIN